MSDSSIEDVLATIDATLDGARARWFDLLRIPSISAQPAHKADCLRAAQFLCDQLTDLGFEARLSPTAACPA